jgi:5-bromo-4-chloroindolyl phosphate hydrolysis protein
VSDILFFVCESPIFVRISTRSQKQSLNNGLTKDDFRIIDKALEVAKTKRDKLKRDNDKRLEGLGKAPAFYPVLLHILNLVSTNLTRYNFYISIFLFMLNTGQRFITSSNVLLTGIKDVIFLQEKVIDFFIGKSRLEPEFKY